MTVVSKNKLLRLFCWQESDGQKTNNGIHYRLQLLYANGKGTDNDVWVGGPVGRSTMSRGQRLTIELFPLQLVVPVPMTSSHARYADQSVTPDHSVLSPQFN